MFEIHRILVPTDFSIHSGRALDYAAKLAALVGAKQIHLLHVFELPAMPVPPSGAAAGIDMAHLEKTMFESSMEALRDRAARIDSASLRVETLVVPGAPATVIARVAEEQSIDLIVMGSRGRSGLAHVLFGSVAERTVAKAPCPILVVKEDEGAEEVEPDAPDRQSRSKRGGSRPREGDSR